MKLYKMKLYKYIVIICFLGLHYALPINKRPSIVTPIDNMECMMISNDCPIVLLHGLEGNNTMDDMKYYIQSKYNRKVYNLDIGDTLYTPMNKQLNILCSTIYNISQLKNGFDFIGMGQGGLLARGYVEKCNKYMVRNLITILSPHGGIYNDNNLNYGNLYSSAIQNNFSISNYWRDPYNYNLYLTNSTFLSDINNEKTNNNTNFNYKLNMLTLHNFIMIYSTNIYGLNYPAESARFSMYRTVPKKIITNPKRLININTRTNIKNGHNLMDLKLVDLFDSELYNNDWLGLKELYKSNRLHIYNTSSYTYSEHTKPIFFNMLGKILNDNKN
jgi:palmitoyl-protein thioesterase